MSVRTGCGIVIGLLTIVGLAERAVRIGWANSSSMAEGVRRLDRLPNKIGGWDAHDIPLDSDIVRVAGCAAYKNVRYEDSRSGRNVTLTIMVGVPSEMAEHAPEACYPSAGYIQVKGSGERHPVSEFLGPNVEGELVTLDFDHPRNTQTLRIWHGWFDGLKWSRPKYPRVVFVGRPLLYRMEVSSFLAPDPYSSDPNQLVDSAKEFLRESLPIFTRILSGGADDKTENAK